MTMDSANRSGLPEEPIGFFYAWWRADDLPVVSSPESLVIEVANDERSVARLTEVDQEIVRLRMHAGQSPWIAKIATEVVGYGWVAVHDAEIGELGLRLRLTEAERYLWDFVTLPRWRGQGIYPAMLQAILTRDTDGERFWIGHDLSNAASAHGIARAGFRKVGAVYRLTDADLVFVPSEPGSRAEAAARLLGIPLRSGSGGGTTGIPVS
jgi:GNAT superfamily N-acetyltransferase